MIGLCACVHMCVCAHARVCAYVYACVQRHRHVMVCMCTSEDNIKESVLSSDCGFQRLSMGHQASGHILA